MKTLLLSGVLVLSMLNLTGQLLPQAIDQILEKHIEKDDFQGSVLIADKGETVYQKYVGLAERSFNQAITKQTTFSIASITKMFTAIIILQMVENDQLNLHDNLQQLLPFLNIPNGENITIHHLLLHISGLPNEKDLIYTQRKTAEEFVRSTLKKGKQIGAFGKFNYNNLDYILLGLVIEKVSGTSWQEEISNKFIKKLQLKHTGFLKKGNYPKDFAYPYHVSKSGKFKKNPLFYIENFFSAGCLYSNASDLLIIDQALYGESLLKEETKTKMFTSYPQYQYTGYGVWTYNYPFAEAQPRIMERRGGILGANGVLIRLLDYNQTIIILSNNDKFNPDSFGNKNNLREALIIELSNRTHPK